MNNFIKNHLNEIKKLNFPNPELELRVLLKYCSINNDEVLLDNFDISDTIFSIHRYGSVPLMAKSPTN